MQVGTRTSFGQQIGRMQSLESGIEKLQTQISTAKRFTRASEDPVGAQRSAQLTRAISHNEQFGRNIDTATARLSLGDSALASVSSSLLRIKELALVASNDTTNADDRRSISAEVTQIRDQLLALANTRDTNGTYVFAASRGQYPAFAEDVDGVVQWQGAGDVPTIAISQDAAIESSLSGADIFEGVPTTQGRVSIFTVVDNFLAALAETDAVTGDPISPADRRVMIDQSIDDTSATINQVSDAQSVVGTRLARLDSEKARLDEVNVDLSAARSAIEDTDLSTAVTQLQQTMLVLQASQASFSKIKSMSLFDYLR